MRPGEECQFCGGEMKLANWRGEVWPYVDDPALEITVDCVLPRCSQCGEGLLDKAMSATLGLALEEPYINKFGRRPGTGDHAE